MGSLTGVGDAAGAGDDAEIDVDPSVWGDIRTRARVVHALACAGASFAELARLAGDDPVVVMAAIAYDEGHPRDYTLMSRDVVVGRLRRLMMAVAPAFGVVAAGPEERIWAHGRDASHAAHARLERFASVAGCVA